ncbi:MAG: DUF4923 family protein [Muribaculaceae bacterium]|nr:DUF4923 family protein [Muribaculaceae bacterium]
MKKIIFSTLIIVCSIFSSHNAYAFDLSSLTNAIGNGTVENIVNGVIGSSDINVADLAGTWKYKAPAIAFESEDILKKAGGVAAATAIENKMAPYYTKAGLANSSITFDSNGNFTLTFKKGKISGTVTKGTNGVFIFNFAALGKVNIGKMNAYVKKGTTLEITFEVTKLVGLLSKIATASGNSTATTAIKLLESYKGIYAGFEFKK